MLLYNSKTLLVNFLEVQYLTHITFHDNAKKIEINSLKSEFFMLFDKMVKRKARLILFDVIKIEHLTDKSFEKWINQTIFPLILSIEASKIAWLFSSDNKFISNFNNYASKKIQQKQFFDPKNAMIWLLKNAKRKKLKFEN